MMGNIRLTSLAIFACSLCFLLFGIRNHYEMMFDEPLYVDGARAFIGGNADANLQHPPLAKMLIAASITVAGDNPLGWRMASAVFGAATLAAIFVWTYLLLESYSIALIATALTALNNFWFVMSRVAMLDVFYFGFVLWAVVAFTAAIKLDRAPVKKRQLILSSGFLFGLAGACKWSAVVSLAALCLAAALMYLWDREKVRGIGIPALLFGLVLVPIAVYCLAFWPLCYRLHRPFTWGELVLMNRFIWRYHVSCPGNPWIDSHWYRWIFRATPERALAYLMGNFVVVWGGFLALLICAWRFCRSLGLAEGLVVLFYAVNLLQWAVIPQQRTVYYYYYPCAMLLSVAWAIAIKRMPGRILGTRPALVLLLAASAFFLYCYPRMMFLGAPYDCALGCWD